MKFKRPIKHLRHYSCPYCDKLFASPLDYPDHALDKHYELFKIPKGYFNDR